MSLDKKLSGNLFLFDDKPRTIYENMAINSECLDLVSKSKKDLVIVRYYKHNPGIILGQSQSSFDVFYDNCLSKNLEVCKRNSGGAAVYVDPKNALCYSVFCNPKVLGDEVKSHNDIYNALTKPLAVELGNNIGVKGTYYFKLDNKTLAGHSLRKTINGIQFDGLIHLDNLDASELGSLIKLRKLYECPNTGDYFLSVGDDTFKVYDNKVSKDKACLENKILVRDEADEIRNFSSLNEVGLSSEDFILAFRNFSKNLFGEFNEVRNHIWDREIFNKFPVEKFTPELATANKSNIGHCFVYIPELEGPEVVHFQPE
jgi:lipoate-protein ligase A